MPSPFRAPLQTGRATSGPRVTGTKGASSGPVLAKGLQQGRNTQRGKLPARGLGLAGNGPGGNTSGGGSPRGKALNVNVNRGSNVIPPQA